LVFPGGSGTPGLPIAFICPNGAPADLRLELAVTTRMAPDVAKAGTLEAWRAATEAALLCDCPHWVLCLVGGFAGVLVSLTGLGTCGINLSGLSSSGKTSGQKIAVSAWSAPDILRPGLFQSARTTDNGIEALAQRATGTVLSLDELAHRETGAIESRAPTLPTDPRAIWGNAESERAAIVEHDGKIPRERAEGFGRLDPDRPPVDVPLKRWQRFIDDVGGFLDGSFCGAAVAGPHDRATKADVEHRRDSLLVIVKTMRPMTVRRVFYQATVRGIVEKSEAGYTKVQTDLVQMRRAGTLPYAWLADNTRWQRKPQTFNSVQDALDATARLYRKALWADADAYVELWLEKDALAGVVLPITALYDVPLMVARGYASLSFLHSAAEYINELEVPVYIYHLGDFDPSGMNAGEKIEETLREMAPDADITFQRIAVTVDQINAWNLPTRPTKMTDSRARGFGEISVELDAIEPNRLRDLARAAIERHLPPDQFKVLKAAEESERTLIHQLVDGLGDAP
jgi:hypothetical protein